MVGCAAGSDWTVEQHAMRVYALAGVEPCNPPGIFALIAMLGGDVAIHRACEFEPGDGRWVEYDDGGWAVEVHPGLPLDVAAMALARGVAHWYVDVHAVSLLPLEGIDDLAASLLLPTQAMLGATQEQRSPERFAEQYRVPIGVAKARVVYCGAMVAVATRSGAFRRA